jgi:hypothetical protein
MLRRAEGSSGSFCSRGLIAGGDDRLQSIADPHFLEELGQVDLGCANR